MSLVLMMLFMLFVYFLPAVSAYSRRHRNKDAILILNLLLGWTVLGWIIAAVWCSTDNVRE